MPRVLRQTLLTLRDLAITAGPFVVLALALLAAAYYLLDPTPPRHVVLASGPPQSDYAEFAKRYADELARYGIRVDIRASEGSSANRRLLRDPAQEVAFGFVVGGSSEALSKLDEDREDVVALGSLFFQPVWLFYRQAAAARLPGRQLTRLAQMKGWRVSLGSRGSGVSNLARKLLHANGIDPESLVVSRLEQTPAVTQLLAGKLDALMMVSAPESPMVQMLLRTPGVRLFEFGQSEAYARRFTFLRPVTLPRGVVDIARDIPPHDIPLVAPTAMLVAREGTHPALVQLFVQAAQRIHGDAGWFSRAGQFPSPDNAELPLAPEAERFYKSGAPLLQRYLPFWLANLIDRMWVALVSIIAVLIPLSRVVPPLYALRVRSRIFRWYRDLRGIEHELTREGTARADLVGRLDRLDAKAQAVVVPLAYADELYRLRSHIRLVRERLQPAPVNIATIARKEIAG